MNRNVCPVRTKLILHFDVNETIMFGSSANGDTLEESLNKIVWKSVYVLDSEDSIYA